MYFLGLGIILLGMKYLEIAPPAEWAWWVVLSPFGMAVVWWAWADWSGYTKRSVLAKENARRGERIDKSREALGMLPKKPK